MVHLIRPQSITLDPSHTRGTHIDEVRHISMEWVMGHGSRVTVSAVGLQKIGKKSFTFKVRPRPHSIRLTNVSRQRCVSRRLTRENT